MADITPIRSDVAIPPQPPAKFPESVEEKIVVARSIVLAVIAADQSGNLEEQNYDSFWPLRMVAELLDQAGDQLDQESSAIAQGRRRWPVISNTRVPGNRRRSGFSGARLLTPEEVAELRRCNLPREGDLNRRAGIEEMRQRLQDRFADAEELSYG